MAIEIVLIGDVVTSRRYVDQQALIAALDDALLLVAARVPARYGPRRVERDRFHAAFDDLAPAVEAALRLRLALGLVALGTTDGELEPIDVRVGLGRGPRPPSPTSQTAATGPAWTLASDACRSAQELPARHGWPASLRSAFRDHGGVEQGAVNAYLLCQDQLFARMDLRDRRALQGLLDGERQVDVATELGITQPAIARRLRDRGALAIHQGLAALRTSTTTTLERN